MFSARRDLPVITSGFVVALMMHLWHLGQPAVLVSDENYFVRDGHRYLEHQPYRDAHPPLGKLQLGAMFTLVGYSPVTWRVMNAVSGALIVSLVWIFAWLLSGRRLAALLAMGLALLDNLLLADSRLGLINMPYVLYSFAAVVAILIALRRPRPWRWLVAAGGCIGLAISVKWLALLVVAPAILMWWQPKLFGQPSRGRTAKRHSWYAALCLIVIPLAVYGIVWQIHFLWLGMPPDFFAANLQMLAHHLNHKVGHPYAEPWWGIPLLWRPFPYWTDRAGSFTSAIWSIGNPWIWWSGLVVWMVSLIRGRRQPIIRFFNIFLLSSWLPFALIPRDMFLYHAMPYGLFLMALIGIRLAQFWPKHRAAVIGYMAVALAVFMWFAPLSLNIPLSNHQWHLREWLPTWVEESARP